MAGPFGAATCLRSGWLGRRVSVPGREDTQPANADPPQATTLWTMRYQDLALTDNAAARTNDTPTTPPILSIWSAVVLGAVLLTLTLFRLGLPATALATVCLAVVLGGVATAPLRYGPSIAVLGYALVPVNYLVVPGFEQLASPLVAGLALWSARVLQKTHRPTAPRWMVTLIAVLGFWLTLLTLTQSVDPVLSMKWCLALGMGVLLPALVVRAVPEAAVLLTRTLLLIASMLGVFGILEAALRENPALALPYRDFGLTQTWAVYRITTTLGHPLSNSLFFVTVASLGFGLALTHRDRFALVASVLAAVAATLTGSFSSAVVAAVAGVLILLASAVNRSAKPGRIVIFALCLAGGVVLSVKTPFSPVADRHASAEAQGSTAYRSGLVTRVRVAALHTHYIGSGPGTTGRVTRALVGNPLPIENGWAELLISTGAVGVGLMALLFAGTGLHALRWGQVGPLGALAAYALAAGAFNWFEGDKSGLGLIGVLLILCWGPRPAPRT